VKGLAEHYKHMPDEYKRAPGATFVWSKAVCLTTKDRALAIEIHSCPPVLEGIELCLDMLAGMLFMPVQPVSVNVAPFVLDGATWAIVTVVATRIALPANTTKENDS
jgi:hypothetical protein